MNDVIRHLRYAIRQCRAARAFTATVVVTLALGIGGTTAIFTLIHAVMLRSLPVGDPSRLYRIGDGTSCCVHGGLQDRWGLFSYPLVARLETEAPEFDEVIAFQAGDARVGVRRHGVDAPPRSLRSEYVTGNYFATLGIDASIGRVLTSADDHPAASPVVVLSHHVWQTTFGGDESIVGATVFVEGHPFTVSGVAPSGFFGETLRPDPPDLWIPLQMEPLINGRGSLLRQSTSAWLRVIGRLRPGRTTDGMRARLTGVLHQWLEHGAGYPSNRLPDIRRALPAQIIDVVPAGAGVGIMKEQYRRSLQILLAVCGLVLVIACGNAANLLLARAAARRVQTAVRLALGASRGQILTEALVESLLLAFAGAAVGLVVASGTARLLVALAFAGAAIVPIGTDPSPAVLAFATGLAVLTGLVFGAVPAWSATRTDPIDALRGAGRTVGVQSRGATQALVILQATLCVVLVAGATMLARSLDRLEGQDFGFEVDGRAVIALNRPPATHTAETLAALYRGIEERLVRLPGVSGVGLAMYNPLTDNASDPVFVAGKPLPEPGERTGASWDRVSPDYLQQLGVKLVRGRYLTRADNETAENVAVVNEAFVKRFFTPTEDPLDRHFGLSLPRHANSYRIVGVVGDAKFAGFALDQPARPMFYVPLAQTVDYAAESARRVEFESHFIRGLLLVTHAAEGTLEPQITRALAEVDPNLTVTSVRTLRAQVERSFDQQRAVARLAGLFGLVALLLGAVGLYGVTAYAVSRRTNEIGIRMALGADRQHVVRMILGDAFGRVVAGAVFGIPLAIGAGRVLAAQLYGVRYWDPAALALAAASLAAAVLAASIIPAARAANIEPVTALRTS